MNGWDHVTAESCRRGWIHRISFRWLAVWHRQQRHHRARLLFYLSSLISVHAMQITEEARQIRPTQAPATRIKWAKLIAHVLSAIGASPESYPLIPSKPPSSALLGEKGTTPLPSSSSRFVPKLPPPVAIRLPQLQPVLVTFRRSRPTLQRRLPLLPGPFLRFATHL
jgi:hypothetical protein